MIVQADDGTIYLMADAFPYGTGSARSQAGSGMITVDGCKYLALTEKGNSVTDMKNFTLYIKEDGTVWDSRTDSATDYSMDEDFNLYKNGSALTVQQRDPSLQYNGTRVPMNIFYEDSELQVYRTSYLWMASSSDGGKTWSAPQILNSLKLESESFLGFGPGRGYVISQGEYKGRILIPVYSTEGTRGERSSVIYSDDNGKTWNRGPASTLTWDSALDPGKTSESQFVELPDGTIRMFTRTCPGNTGWGDGVKSLVSYTAESRDGGRTWTKPVPTGIRNNESKIDVISWDKDTILMAYNDTPVADWHERSPLTLACSHDEGRTWHNLLDLAPAPGNKCQPAMCKGPDGRLHVIYMHRHTAIEHLVVEVEK